MKNAQIVKRRATSIKKRSSSCYDRKVKKVTDWHNRLKRFREEPQRENPNTNLFPKRKELIPLEYYIEKIKKPTRE
jgi:hypothetical protein